MPSKKVSGQGMKGATQMAGERVAWRALVKTTAALYSAPKVDDDDDDAEQIWLLWNQTISQL